MKKIIPIKCIFLVVVIAVYCLIGAYSETAVKGAGLYDVGFPDIKAEAYILIDLNSGAVLAEKNADKKMAPASVTKIMTAAVALSKAKPDMIMTANASAINKIGYDYVRAGIVEGEELTMNDLLHALLITSANEAANIIAQNIAPSGKIEDFVDMMNSLSIEMGCTSTHFQNTFGYDHDEHYTTARDLARITSYTKKNFPVFNEIVIMDSYTLPETNKHKSNEWLKLPATNKLLGVDSVLYDKITGVKTGLTNNAGHCLVSSAIDNKGLELIAVVLKTDMQNNVFEESKKLLEFGYSNFAYQIIETSEQLFNEYNVVDANEAQKITIITDGELHYLLPKDESSWNIDTKVFFDEGQLIAPITKNTQLGRIEYYVSDKYIGEIKLVAANDVDISFFASVRNKAIAFWKGDLLKKILRITIYIIVGFILLLILLRIFFRGIRRSRRRKNGRKNRYRIDNL